MSRQYTEIEKQRRNKLKIYKEKNMQTYSRDINFDDNSKSLKEKYDVFSKQELQEKNISSSISFRIMTTRGPFIIGKDAHGKVQVYVDKNSNKSIIEIRDLLDIGDIIKATGIVMKTNTGELSIKASDIKLITKSLKPLPEKFHGLKDVEEKYRRRYVDLLMNDETKKTFWTRTKIISYIRSFFDNNNYMEVDTPILSPILGGAAAKPFITKHNALDMNFYLRVATELPLKRLLVGGIERVYEIGRLFRNEGIDTSHNPEFTTIEFYESYANLESMMTRTEELFSFIAKKLNVQKLEYDDQTISLKTPFKRINLVEEVSKAINQDVTQISFEEASKIAKEYKIKVLPYYKIGHIINELFEELIEKNIKEPTFVFNYPIEISPLAAKNEADPRFTERAELFINGREYANMFTELNDPIDQLERFEQQIIEAKKGNDEANEIDIDYVEALEYGMPPAGGCGIGIDRLIMLFTGKRSIREVLLFPHLRNKGVKNDE